MKLVIFVVWVVIALSALVLIVSTFQVVYSLSLGGSESLGEAFFLVTTFLVVVSLICAQMLINARTKISRVVGGLGIVSLLFFFGSPHLTDYPEVFGNVRLNYYWIIWSIILMVPVGIRARKVNRKLYSNSHN